MKKSRIIMIILLIIVFAGTITLLLLDYFYKKDNSNYTYKVNITNLTYQNKKMTVYTQDDFDTFLNAYNTKTLPEVYITEFLFDGVSMYKPLDYDDFVNEGNSIKVDPLKITNININTTKKLEFTGTLKGGMISVNTNSLDNDINIIFNDVKLDTDSKKVPAIYVYNKDINYTEHKVTITTNKKSKNYIEGGKLKKVSLVPSEDISNYSSYYTANIGYDKFSNYYGVYSSADLGSILFAKVMADKEDLADGDPYYFYKAAGAISSDIDLYFKGEGYLEVTSKNKEGIETKGNLTFSGSKGDYYISAEDDCLNTTTSKNEIENARNTITIDVNSLTAIVSLGASEGDAIDSNGDLIINKGRVIAIAKPGSDAGLDSETGTYINGGTVLVTGDMLDSISGDSKQKFIVLSFSNKPEAGDLITLVDKNNKNIFAYKTDRTYTNLVYSGNNLEIGNYSLYKNGDIEGVEEHGFYKKINTYNTGVQLAYSSLGNQNNGSGGNPPENGDIKPPMDNGGTPPEKPDGDNNPPERQDGNNPQEMPNSETSVATNKVFTITDISTYFNGIAPYAEL